ncbi:MAG: hypothetical protein NT096_00120 [Proteobacteria bacterium]|nr:hypothetical protein [Pseudomonadota bacterium]
MKIERKDAIKSLWIAIEDTIKALKALAENPVVNSVSQLWENMDAYKESLRGLLECNHIILGKYYKNKRYGDEWIIFRAEVFTSQDSNRIQLKVAVVTASKKKFDYNDVTNEMHLSLSIAKDSEEIDLDPKDLPLYVSNEFHGTLFKELMTKAGLKLDLPEPKPEE